MSDKQTRKAPWGLIAVMAVLAGAGAYVVKGVISDEGPRKKNAVSVVTLLKPPPAPPPVKEKPPEPEVKKEEVMAPMPQEEARAESRQTDDQPAGDQGDAPSGGDLGVDAEGAAGGDAFGLVGKKGGRSILGAGGGVGGMARFGAYNHVVETEINKRIMKLLDAEGGIPRGKFQAVAKINVGPDGAVVGYSIIGSSGNNKMDDAVSRSLGKMKLSEQPPDGKSCTITIRISYSVG